MQRKEKSSVHIVEFPLIAMPSDIKEIEVRFSFLRQLYNAALAELFKRNISFTVAPCASKNAFVALPSFVHVLFLATENAILTSLKLGYYLIFLIICFFIS